jgi:hypothetical protein
MNGVRYAELVKPLPILAPADIVASATSTQPVDLDMANWISFWVQFGALTSDSTDTCTITVETSTGASTAATDTAIAFKYRLSAAVATDTMGAITDATASGVAVPTATDDNKGVWIDVDPSAAAAADTDAKFIRVVLTPNAEMASCVVGATAFIEHRYPGNSIPSST